MKRFGGIVSSVLIVFSLVPLVCSLPSEAAPPPPQAYQQGVGRPLPDPTLNRPNRRPPALKPKAPFEGPSITPAYELSTQGIAVTATAADLQPTIDAPITPEIQALAQRLGFDPKAIYLYVKNHIDYTPYGGSQKGAQGTLRM